MYFLNVDHFSSFAVPPKIAATYTNGCCKLFRAEMSTALLGVRVNSRDRTRLYIYAVDYIKLHKKNQSPISAAPGKIVFSVRR